MKVKIHQSVDLQWYFVVVGRNGRIIATSETYRTKRGAVKSARLFNLPIIESAK